jgi:hypothetical protein
MASGGEQRQGDGWLPPVEARPLGTGGVAVAGWRRRSPVKAAAIGTAAAVVALLIIGWLISLAEGEHDGSLEGVVHEFVDARAAGDAARACDQLTERAQRDMVALVRGVDQPEASAADCERIVLLASERSEFTDPALPEFRDRSLSVRHFPGADGRRYATVTPAGREDPFLELREVHGEWKLDGLAAERVSFVAGCVDKGAPRGYCGCVFDRLAADGRASQRDLTELFRAAQSGSVPPDVQEAAGACGGKAGPAA